MTPFRNDQENPFSRESVWPKMPQTPLNVAPTRPAPSRYAPPRDLDLDEAVVIAARAEPELSPAPPQAAPRDVEFEPLMFSRPSRVRPPRRRLRLTPLIGAAAVGVAGLATLFLLIGTGARP